MLGGDTFYGKKKKQWLGHECAQMREKGIIFI